MRIFLSLVAFWAPAILAATHYMLVGTFSTNSIYTLTFDDETNQLTEVANTSTPVGSSWLTLSKDKRTLYGTAWDVQPAAFVSYAVAAGKDDDGPALTHQATVQAGGNCTGSAISVLAAIDPPWTVYGNLYYLDARCATVFSVDAANAGALDGGIVQTYTYDLPGSAVHGMTWSAAMANVVYSADTGGNAIWTHSRDGGTGALTPVGKLVLPAERGHCGPRHIAAHPLGVYLYVVCEASSKIIQLRLNEDEFATPNATAADKEWPLLRDGEDPADFWADEVLISALGGFMWASNRAHETGRRGYVSVFTLQSEDGDVEAQMFLQETATSGGFANAVAPSPFDDRVAALTENVTGSVEIWRTADDYRSASVVAHLDLPDGGGCCANVVWYS
ncbi:carboxy-cis-cis-muconate cyclase [Apiospora saccharicola]|uniref:Carboxy-cis-cis-muconate cyclase n=1 Tax=Apiospora saccharicola TaxID=335842 RepID=A0ABR1VPX1_9PEZI